jgi:small GTP-binding protein
LVGKQTHRLHIWDTAGQETYHSITGPYFRNAAGVLLFFDLSDRHSFEALSYWLNLIEENTNALPSIVLVGNKCDLSGRELAESEIQEFCRVRELQYFEASALNGKNVEESLMALVELIVQYNAPVDAVPIDPVEVQESEKRCCSALSHVNVNPKV